MAEKNRFFYLFSLLGFAVSFALILQTDGEALKPFFYYYKDYCMDFYNHILYVQDPKHVYESSVFATFPPLAYIFYYLLGKCIPPSVVAGEGGRALRDNLLGMNLYVTYTAVLSAFLILAMEPFTEKLRRGERWLLTGIILLSAPFIGLYERGNSVFLVLVLLFAFLYLRDSERAWKREAALLLLATASAFKLYPAVFGLLYLREKRWKEAIRLTGYGIFLVFAPFVFFGGWEAISVLLYNFQFITEGFMLGGDLRSVAYVTVLIGEWFGKDPAALYLLGEKLAWLFLAFSCLCVLWQGCLWKRLVLLDGIMIFFPGWSGSYTLIYLTLPLILYLGEGRTRETRSGLDIWYQILFACVFTLMLWNPQWSQRFFHSEFSYTIRALGAWGLVLTVMADTCIKRFIKFIKKK